MDKLNRLKGTVKAAITRLEQFLTDTTDVKTTNVSTLEVKLKKTEGLQNKLEEIREQYFDIQELSAQQIQDIEEDIDSANERLEQVEGCTRSYHSNVKPPEPPKSNTQNKVEEVQTIPQPLEKKEVFVRPDANEPLISIPSVIGSSLKPVLDKMKKENTQEVDKVRDKTVQKGAPCQNKGCKATYKGEESNMETCLHHSGIPIFHEGLKYWSCCVKRTTDFDSFLEQVGCTTGNHKWYKDDDENQAAATKCRYDWHQTGNNVIISVYSKCPIPDLSFVEANQVKLHIHITFGEKKYIFDEEILLFGAISVADCLVTYLGSKVEIKLKKSGYLQPWKYLTFNPEKVKSVFNTEKNSNQDNNKD